MITSRSLFLCLIGLALVGCTAGSSREIAAGTADAVVSSDNLPAPTPGAPSAPWINWIFRSSKFPISKEACA